MVLYCCCLTEQWPRFFVSLPAICVFGLGPMLFTIFSALMLDGQYQTCTRQLYVDSNWCAPDCKFHPDVSIYKYFGLSNPRWSLNCSNNKTIECNLNFGIRDVPRWAISNITKTDCLDDKDNSVPAHPPGTVQLDYLTSIVRLAKFANAANGGDDTSRNNATKCSAKHPEICAKEYTQMVNTQLRRLSRFSQTCQEVLKGQPRYQLIKEKKGQSQADRFAREICPKRRWVLLTKVDRGKLADKAIFYVNAVPGIAFILIGVCWLVTFIWTLVDLIKGIKMTGCFCPGIDGTLIHGPGHNVVQSVLVYLGILLIAIWPERTFMLRMAPLITAAFWLGVKAAYYPINHKISGNSWQGGNNLLGQAWSMNYGVMSTAIVVQMFTLAARLDESCCRGSSWSAVFVPIWVWAIVAVGGWIIFINCHQVKYHFCDNYDQEVDSGYLCFQFIFFISIAIFLSCTLMFTAVNLESYDDLKLTYQWPWMWVCCPLFMCYALLVVLWVFDLCGDAIHKIKIAVQNLSDRTRKNRVERQERRRRQTVLQMQTKDDVNQAHASIPEVDVEAAGGKGAGGEEDEAPSPQYSSATQRFCEHIGSVRTAESAMFCQAVLSELVTLLDENSEIRTDTNRQLLTQACEDVASNQEVWTESVAQLYKEIIVKFQSLPEPINAEIN